MSDFLERMRELKTLFEEGVLSEAEFEQEKAALLATRPRPQYLDPPTPRQFFSPAPPKSAKITASSSEPDAPRVRQPGWTPKVPFRFGGDEGQAA